MQKPAKCRMVLVAVPPEMNNGDDDAPAVITRVWSDEMINVRVFLDQMAMPLSMTSVKLCATAEEAGQVREANPAAAVAWWPPRV